MINWETIKSLYNDKPTLMEWLKKVEAALTGATLTSVSVNTISVGVISLTFEFDDGTSITTPNINLPQGAQGVSITGAAIVAGKLILTLSNGTTIDAGNTGAVLGFEIDNNQHLIVKYQDGTSEDLGAIFTGNVSITGNFSVAGDAQIFENITDASGNKRFIEGNIAPAGIIGVNDVQYAKWSLSGSHLMIVLAIITSQDVTAAGSLTANVYIPSWLGAKIFAMANTSHVSLIDSLYGFYPNNLAKSTSSVRPYLHKTSDTELNIITEHGTYQSGYCYRIQFDLVIDTQ